MAHGNSQADSVAGDGQARREISAPTRALEDYFPVNPVRIVYFDEAGTGSEAILTVASVIVHADKQMPIINADVRELRERLDARKRRAFEFKADKMFAHYRKFGKDSLYGDLMREFLRVMKNNEIVIVPFAVNRAGFNANNVGSLSDLDFAFASCAIDTSSWLKDNASNEGALFIADPSRIDATMYTVIKDLRDGIPNIDIPPVDSIVDTIFFGASKRSTGIQMADYANFFLKMHCLKDSRAEPFFQIIESLFTQRPISIGFENI
jgi:hypothetical protein